jgi:DNA-binding transcriptional LysR family regulator
MHVQCIVGCATMSLTFGFQEPDSMTLVQLRHFVSLAGTGSFAKSAAEMFLTQPALSRSIRALEAELGQPLFDRIGRRSELAPFGRQALARARELLLQADDLRSSGRLANDDQHGVLRIGMGSGPGAMLMTPLLLQTALERPRFRVEIARGRTDLLVQELRDRTLDALVVDARSLRPAPDLSTRALFDMRGTFMARRAHPLARRRRALAFTDLQPFPIASTPLSDEVARALVERYGPEAHPNACVTLRCEELPSLVDVARHSDTVLLAIRAAAPDLVELDVRPVVAISARFGLVTLARRSEPPGLGHVQALMERLMHDRPAARTKRAARQ